MNKFLDKISKLSIFKKREYKTVGLDLGTGNTVIYLKDKGIVLDEPTFVSLNIKTEELDKIGREAKKIVGKEPNYIKIEKPLRDNTISDYDLAVKMLNEFFRQVTNNEKEAYKILATISSGVTQVQKKAMFNALTDIGGKEVYLIEEPIAAAIGAGIDIFEPKGHLIVNVGAGTTEISFISSGGTSKSGSIKIAGDTFDDDIIEFIRDQFSILVGQTTAEELKMKATINEKKEEVYEIRGSGTIKGLPESLKITSEQINNAITKNVENIVNNVKIALEEIGPEISADIYETGIYLTGGCANIKLLERRLTEEFKLKVTIPADPIHAVINGISKIMEDFDKYKDIMLTENMEY